MKLTLAASLIAAASANSSRNLQDYTAIAGFTPLTDVRDQVRIASTVSFISTSKVECALFVLWRALKISI